MVTTSCEKRRLVCRSTRRNGEPVVFECRRRSNHQAFFYVSFTIDEGADKVVGDNIEEKKAEEEDNKDVD